MSTSIIPLSVKLLNKQTEVKASTKEVSVQEKGTVTSKTPLKEYDQPPHEHFVSAMDAMSIHWAILLDFIPLQESHKADLSKIHITGVTISGKEKSQGIIITGYRDTSRGRSMIANTPLEMFDPQKEGDRYPLMDDVLKKWEVIKAEFLAYVLEGKIGKPKVEQTKMELPEEGAKVTKMKIAHPEKKEPGEYTPEEYAKAIDKNKGAGIADPEAMARVAEIPPTGKKRVAQTAANKSGIVE